MLGPRLLALLLLTFALPLAAAPRMLHFVHGGSADSPRGRAAEHLAQEINTRLADRLHIDVHHDGTWFDDEAALRELRFDTGAMQAPARAGGQTPDRLRNGLMTAVDIGLVSRLGRQLTVFELPYLFPDLDAAHRLIDSSLFKRITASLPRAGLVAMTVWDGGMRNFALQVPADHPAPSTRPEALANARFAATPSAVDKLIATTLHAQLVPSTGDGNTSPNAHQGTWWTLTSTDKIDKDSYVITTAHRYEGYLVMISEDFWAALPDELRNQLRAAIAAATTVNRRDTQVTEARAREEFIATAGADHVLATADRKAWRVALSPISEHLKRRVGLALFEDVKHFLATAH